MTRPPVSGLQPQDSQSPTPREMYLDGAWVPASGGVRMPIINPATEEVVDSVPVATAADLDRALAAADRAWRVWREVDVWTGSAALRRAAQVIRARADTFATVLTEEQGKPLTEARGEVLAAADQFDCLAGYVLTNNTRTAFRGPASLVF